MSTHNQSEIQGDGFVEPLEIVDLPASPVKWEYLKIFSAGVSFFVAGINDGSLGSIIPYLLKEYAISTNMVSIL